MNLVFDLDGTLIDSSQRHKLVFRDVLEKHGILISPLQQEEYMRYKSLGNSTMDYLIAVMHLPENQAKQLVEDWVLLIEDEQYLSSDQLYPDVLDILHKLSASHNIMYLTARKNRDGVEQQLKQYGLSTISKQLSVVSPINAKKEKKQVIERFGLIKADTIIIGDTYIEYAVADELGINCIILNRGFRSKEYWDELGILSYPSLESALVHLC